MTTQSQARPLSGTRLDAFLDEVEACLANHEEIASVDGPTSAAELIKDHTIQVNDLGQLGRVFDLWWRTGNHDVALQVLNDQKPALLSTLTESEHHTSELQILFWQLNALHSIEAGHHFKSILNQTIDKLSQLPDKEQQLEAWQHLVNLTETIDDQNIHRKCLHAKHGCLRTQPERKHYKTWDDATLSAQLGKSHAAANEADDAHKCAEKAIYILSSHTSEQDIDYFDWLNLGDFLISFAPEIYESVATNIIAILPSDLPAPLRRGIDVRLARQASHALFNQGNTEAALEKSQLGRFMLREDKDDVYSAHVLDWLLSVGRTTEAAALAFESVFNERNTSSKHACQTAQQQLASGATEVYWHLALAFIATTENFTWVTNKEDKDSFINHHLTQVENRTPDLPALNLLQAMRLMDEHSRYDEALPILEQATQYPYLSNPDSVGRIWLCRFHLYGPEKALSLPLVECTSANWCYNMGVILNNHIEDKLPQGTPWPEEAVEVMAARYYELGRKKFETFFSSGNGTMGDADVHVYSMLCNNLANYCRTVQYNYEAAIDLHQRGIPVSPFAEHYYNLMQCRLEAGQKVEFVESADKLWHYAMEYGYCRHDPTSYLQDLTTTLYELGRANEVTIWLQRLEDWWADQDDDDRTELHEDYLSALATGLCNLAQSQPDDALARLDPLIPEILANDRPGQIRVCGLALIYTGQKKRGLALLDEASKAGNPDDDWDKSQRKHALQTLKQQRKNANWWKLW